MNSTVLATILVLLIVSWITFKIFWQLRFARQFSERLTERTQKGPLVYGSNGHTQEAATKELQALYRSTLHAWCAGDAKAYGAAFTEDAEYIAFTGEITRGRDAIMKAHQELFERWLKGSCLEGAIESIRYLSPDVAVLVTLGGTTFDGNKALRRPSIQSYVAHRVDERWLFSNFQNSRVADGNVLDLILLGIRTKVLRM